MSGEATLILEGQVTSYGFQTYKQIINNSYNPNSTTNPVPSGYEHYSTMKDTASGLVIETYKNTATDKYVVAFRGTEFPSPKDLSTDVQMALDKVPGQVDVALAYVTDPKFLSDIGGASKIEAFVGDSMGGTQAQLAGSLSQFNNVATVTTSAYGGAHLLDNLSSQYSFSSNHSNISNYGILSDYVFNSREQLGNTYTLNGTSITGAEHFLRTQNVGLDDFTLNTLYQPIITKYGEILGTFITIAGLTGEFTLGSISASSKMGILLGQLGDKMQNGSMISLSLPLGIISNLTTKPLETIVGVLQDKISSLISGVKVSDNGTLNMETAGGNDAVQEIIDNFTGSGLYDITTLKSLDTNDEYLLICNDILEKMANDNGLTLAQLKDENPNLSSNSDNSYGFVLIGNGISTPNSTYTWDAEGDLSIDTIFTGIGDITNLIDGMQNSVESITTPDDAYSVKQNSELIILAQKYGIDETELQNANSWISTNTNADKTFVLVSSTDSITIPTEAINHKDISSAMTSVLGIQSSGDTTTNSVDTEPLGQPVSPTYYENLDKPIYIAAPCPGSSTRNWLGTLLNVASNVNPDSGSLTDVYFSTTIGNGVIYKPTGIGGTLPPGYNPNSRPVIVSVGFHSSTSTSAKVCVGGNDPLILDLNCDLQVSTTAVDSSDVYFDYNQNGFKNQTGWASPEDGLLAIDANNNQKIDNVSELFGNKDITGFEELKTLKAA